MEAIAHPEEVLEEALFEAKRVLVGQDLMIERLFVCWLSRGHCLLEGAPGLAKTLAAETVARILGGSFARLQFTPDLVPADLVGTRIYRPSQEAFDIELGPIFANVVLADEINRAPAKVQSALLEVMAERQVSIGGVTHPVPAPFIVLATQNPIESEGVYPLPEAQRDRFLMKVVVGYPSGAEEAEIVRRMSVDPPRAKQVLDARPDGVAATVGRRGLRPRRGARLRGSPRARHAASRKRTGSTTSRASSPTAAARAPRSVSSPPARSLALLRGRNYVMPKDIYDVARDVLRHRVLLSYEALADGVTAEDVVDADRARRSACPASPRRRTRPPSSGPASLPRRDEASRSAGARTAPAARSPRQPQARRAAHGDYQGYVRGPGSEAGDARLYQPGDDARRIDWSLTARTQRRRTCATRSPTASSRRGSSSTAPRASTSGPRTARSGTSPLAGRGRVRVPHLARRATGSPQSCFDGDGDRGAAAPQRSRRGARVAAPHRAAPPCRRTRRWPRIPRGRTPTHAAASPGGAGSSWSSPTSSTGATGHASCAAVATRHEVVVAQICDPREAELPPVGLLTLVDPETGRRQEVQTEQQKSRERFATAAAEQRATITPRGALERRRPPRPVH